MDEGKKEEVPTYTFRIIFSGLCAFIPNKDLEKETPTRTDVLLVHTRHKHRPRKLKLGPHEPHLAVLKYNLRDVANTGHEAPESAGSYGVWTLWDEELRLEVREKEVPQHHGFEWGDLSLVPRIDKIFPEVGFLDPGAAGDNPELAIARFVVDQGKLDRFKQGVYSEEPIWVQFLPSVVSAEPQQVTYQVQLTLTLRPEEQVTIRSRKFGSSVEAPDYRSVTFVPAAADELVRVQISNLCCGQFMDYDGDYEIPAPDRDFEFHYILGTNFLDLADKYVRFPIPVPVKYKTKTDPKDGGGDTIRCNLSMFNPKSE